MGDTFPTCILRFPSVKIGNQSIRFIYFREPNLFYVTKREKDTDIPLFLGVDVLSGSSISSNNYSRTHERFSKQSLCTVISLIGVRVEGINHSNKLWFYNTQGLFRVAFEYLNSDAQKDCLVFLKDLWIETLRSNVLPRKIQLQQLANECHLIEGIEKGQPLCIVSTSEYSVLRSHQDIDVTETPYLDAACSSKSDDDHERLKRSLSQQKVHSPRKLDLDDIKNPSVVNMTSASSIKECLSQGEHYILPLSNLDKNTYSGTGQHLLELDAVESRFEIVGGVADGHSLGSASVEMPKTNQIHMTKLPQETLTSCTDLTCEVGASLKVGGVGSAVFGNTNTKPNLQRIHDFNQCLKSFIEEQKQTLSFSEDETVMLEKLDVLLRFFSLEVLRNASEDLGFPLKILEQYTNVLSGKSKPGFVGDDYDTPNRTNIALCLISRWLGKELHGFSQPITAKVEAFKLRNIDQINHLPSSQSLVNQLFPSCMVILLMNWMGNDDGESDLELGNNPDDLKNDVSYVPPVKKRSIHTQENKRRANVHHEKEKQNVFPFVQLILEFVNNVLISGVAHVLYSRLLQDGSC